MFFRIVSQDSVGRAQGLCQVAEASLKISGERIRDGPVSFEITGMQFFDVSDHRRHQRHRLPLDVLMVVFQLQFGFDPANPGMKSAERALKFFSLFRRQGGPGRECGLDRAEQFEKLEAVIFQQSQPNREDSPMIRIYL